MKSWEPCSRTSRCLRWKLLITKSFWDPQWIQLFSYYLLEVSPCQLTSFPESSSYWQCLGSNAILKTSSSASATHTAIFWKWWEPEYSDLIWRWDAKNRVKKGLWANRAETFRFKGLNTLQRLALLRDINYVAPATAPTPQPWVIILLVLVGVLDCAGTKGLGGGLGLAGVAGWSDPRPEDYDWGMRWNWHLMALWGYSDPCLSLADAKLRD